MKQRKLKSYVLPTLQVIILMLVFGAVSLVSSFMKKNTNYLYSVDVLGEEETQTVVDTQDNFTNEEVPRGIIKPFTSEKVQIAKTFYDIKGTPEEQQNSLINFQNTYMKNTGVLYNSNEEFEVMTILDGTVISVKEDEILGNVVEVEHNDNLRTVYYSITPSVKVGDVLSQGEIVGIASTNKISESKYNLLMEVYCNGTLLNPEEFYNMDLSTIIN